MNDPQIEPGDRVRDPLDGELRTVTRVDGDSIHMEDGGVMGRRECANILLPSEPATPDTGGD